MVFQHRSKQTRNSCLQICKKKQQKRRKRESWQFKCTILWTCCVIGIQKCFMVVTEGNLPVHAAKPLPQIASRQQLCTSGLQRCLGDGKSAGVSGSRGWAEQRGEGKSGVETGGGWEDWEGDIIHGGSTTDLLSTFLDSVGLLRSSQTCSGKIAGTGPSRPRKGLTLG